MDDQPPVPAPPPAPAHYDAVGRAFVLGCLAVALFLGWKVLRPFLTAIAAAAIIDVVFYPVFHRLTRRLGGRRAVAAALTVLLVVICVLIPLVVLGAIFTRQALQLYDTIGQAGQGSGVTEALRVRGWDAVEAWIASHAPWVDARALNLRGLFLAALERVSGLAVGFGSALAGNVLAAAATFAVMLFCLFFFLLDGATFLRWLSAFSPLNAEHERRLFDTFVGITKSAVLGSGVIAVAQGILGGVAFRIVGLPGILWGFVMAFTSLLPIVGAAIIWVPAGLWLLMQERVGAALFVLGWGAFVISSTDNVIRMFVVKGPVRMHPLLIFFSVVGGIKAAGFLGVVLGPLVIAMIQAILEIYRGEFLGRDAPPAATGGEP